MEDVKLDKVIKCSKCIYHVYNGFDHRCLYRMARKKNWKPKAGGWSPDWCPRRKQLER